MSSACEDFSVNSVISVVNMQKSLLCLLCLWLFCTGCAPRFDNEKILTHSQPLPQSSYLVILVDAPHLDTSSNRALCQTIAKHPSNGSKAGDVGHAWIYLHGWLNGKEITIEGGHSGERGIVQPTYFEGIVNYINFGFSHPTSQQKLCPVKEPNPIKYLWEIQRDGFFQKGAGGHQPTYAVKVNLSDSQLREILRFIHPCNYLYEEYSLINHQCTTFAVEVAALAGLELECQKTIEIGQTLKLNGETLCLWTDPTYSTFSFASPDILECSLKCTVMEGRAECAMDWYRQHCSPPFKDRFWHAFNTLYYLPQRLYRISTF